MKVVGPWGVSGTSTMDVAAAAGISRALGHRGPYERQADAPADTKEDRKVFFGPVSE